MKRKFIKSPSYDKLQTDTGQEDLDIRTKQVYVEDKLVSDIYNSIVSKMTSEFGYDIKDAEDMVFVSIDSPIDDSATEICVTIKNSDKTLLNHITESLDSIVKNIDSASMFNIIDDETIQAFVNTYNYSRDNERSEVMSSEDIVEEYEEDIQEIGQEFTSENTSINSNKLPAVFKMVSFEPGTVNIDYGGGRFDNVAEYLAPLDVINLVYDPYNRSKEHNREVLRLVREHGGADTATCSNVLNVIKEPEVRINVLQNIKKLVKPGGTVYITVYEGTGKGNEGPTKSGYQLNKKTENYLEEIQQVFPQAQRKGKLIHAINASESIMSSMYESCIYTSGIKIDENDEFLEMLKKELYDSASELMQTPEFGFVENEIPSYLFVEVIDGGDHILAEVRCEVTYEGLMDLAEHLNPIVSKYDEDAYFDAETSGILRAYIRDNTIVSSINDDFQPIRSEVYMQYPEDTLIENSITEYVELDLDTNIIMNSDGSWEYEDEKYTWARSEDKYGDWYSSTYYELRLIDHIGAVERTDELIEHLLPMEPGKYRIQGHITLAFDVSDVEYKRVDDELKEYYTKDAKIEFNFAKSEVSNFRWEMVSHS